MIKKFFIALCFILIPILVHADVFINEVAWMGTTVSANAEWIELYNNSPSPVTLDGWALSATDGSPSIALSGAISGSGYALLERTNDDTVPAVTATVIYSGSLSNSGEHLQLKDNVGTIIDDVDATTGWQGGDNTTKQTMQRNGANWATSVATPGAETVVFSHVPTEIGTTPTTSVSTVVKQEEINTPDVIEVKRDPVFTARMVAPDVGTAGVAVPITVLVKEDGKKDLVSGRFEWSMGDGKNYAYDHNESLSHIFYYPGSYTVTLTYYSSIFKTEPDSIHKKVITIVPSDVTITGRTDDGGVILKNDSTKDIPIDLWSIRDGRNSFIFPKYTVVGKGQELSISSHVLGFITDEAVSLSNPTGVFMKKSQERQQVILGEEIEGGAQPSQDPVALPKEIVPEVKTFKDIWKGNKWYFIAGVLGLGIILAYFAFRLYAERDQWL